MQKGMTKCVFSWVLIVSRNKGMRAYAAKKTATVSISPLLTEKIKL